MSLPKLTVEAMMDAEGSVFPSDLSGYSAGEAALYLQQHWDTCDPPLDAKTKAGDVQDVIDVLARWKGQLAATTPTYPREDVCAVCGIHLGWSMDPSMDGFMLGHCEEHAELPTFTCPTVPIPDVPAEQQIIGCGHTFKAALDDECMVDCPKCGISFTPALEDTNG